MPISVRKKTNSGFAKKTIISLEEFTNYDQKAFDENERIYNHENQDVRIIENYSDLLDCVNTLYLPNDLAEIQNQIIWSINNYKELDLTESKYNHDGIYNSIKIASLYFLSGDISKSAQYYQMTLTLLQGCLDYDARRIEQKEFAPLAEVPTGSDEIGSCVYVAFCQNGQVGGFHLDINTDPQSLSDELAKIPPGEVGIRVFGAMILPSRKGNTYSYQNIQTVFNAFNFDTNHDYILLSNNIYGQKALAVCAYPNNDKGINFEVQRRAPYYGQEDETAREERLIRHYLGETSGVRQGFKTPYFLSNERLIINDDEIKHFTHNGKFPSESNLKYVKGLDADATVLMEGSLLLRKQILTQNPHRIEAEQNERQISKIEKIDSTKAISTKFFGLNIKHQSASQSQRVNDMFNSEKDVNTLDLEKKLEALRIGRECPKHKEYLDLIKGKTIKNATLEELENELEALKKISNRSFLS